MNRPLSNGRWTIQAEGGSIEVDAGRVGPIALHATAPISGGRIELVADRAQCDLVVALSHVETGSAVLDVETKAFVRRTVADGILVFTGQGTPGGASIDFAGHASAGHVTVPLTLTGATDGASSTDVTLRISGRTVLDQAHIPLLGVGQVRGLKIRVSGLARLSPA